MAAIRRAMGGAASLQQQHQQFMTTRSINSRLMTETATSPATPEERRRRVVRILDEALHVLDLDLDQFEFIEQE